MDMMSSARLLGRTPAETAFPCRNLTTIGHLLRQGFVFAAAAAVTWVVEKASMLRQSAVPTCAGVCQVSLPSKMKGEPHLVSHERIYEEASLGQESNTDRILRFLVFHSSSAHQHRVTNTEQYIK